MKTLKIYIKESIFDDVEDIASNDTVLIEQFLKDNYKITGSYIIKGGVVDVKGDVTVKNKNIESLTNGLFRFGVVSKDFDCTFCPGLVSLEGAPEEVGEVFWCAHCSGLISLKGGPKKVGGYFDCTSCTNLKSLEGAPEKVGDYIYTYECDKLVITDSDRKKYKIKS